MADLHPINSFRVGALGLLLDALLAILGVRISVNGIDRVPSQSVIFASNHFTRLETIFLPRIIKKRLGVVPRSLTDRQVFEALPKDFMESVGSVPTNIPDRDSVAVRSLLAGETWIIFPEGRMVKDKKVVSARRFIVHEGKVTRPPHTGTAAIALKAQLAAGMMSEFAEKYHISKIFGLEHLGPLDIKIVPINITYYPERFFRTPFTDFVERATHLFRKGALTKRFQEELRVESSFLRRGMEIIVNFGNPRRIAPYAAWLDEKTVNPVFREETVNAFSRSIRAITNDYMTQIYRLTTINPDHLMARLFFSMVKRRRYSDDWDDVKRRVFLAALRVRDLGGVSCHKTISENPHALIVWGERTLEGFLDMGIHQGLLEKRDGTIFISEEEFKRPHEFHHIRIANTIEVIKNEIEPLPDVAESVDETLKLGGKLLKERTTSALISIDREHYLKDYARFYVKDESKEMKFGMPALHFAGPSVGVLLVHGYLTSPEQMRPLLEYLTHQGITAYNARLAGHGTSALDLATTDRRQWFYSVRLGYTILSQLVEKVFVCGFGMGGLLGWLLATQGPPKLDGVVSISAAMRQDDRFAALAPSMDLVDHLARKIGIRENPIEFTKKESENPHFTYPRNPVHGMYQIRVLIREVRRQLPRITVPALIIQGGDNPAVDPEGAREYFDAISSKVKGIVRVESPYHGITYRGDDEIFGRIAAFVKNPVEGVADFSGGVLGGKKPKKG
jgi:esterase/lipase/1-acyl-sn-glycerol-3-phosphate acyltransferase